METIELNGKTYYSEKPECVQFEGEYKIVVLQRGWVLVGIFEREGNDCQLHNASVIRIWGTTKGLGELAEGGPTDSTKLDKCHGLVQFDYLTMVFSICVDPDKWQNVL